ncbi:hypothetical protein SAMN05421780_10827 [Flexibacter flexilis DSM 6793]|uniref:Uncharacterized protein n=1 Tax=Flexibacter flexilis DSM 6793 TaxID=927664 RepID=A0A1I1L414_9BACT|nr:hypothetical protein SAMN05421780_10827 [Flexibacter flexilis DSM 6793]
MFPHGLYLAGHFLFPRRWAMVFVSRYARLCVSLNPQFLLKSSPWGGFRRGLNIYPSPPVVCVLTNHISNLQLLLKSSPRGGFRKGLNIFFPRLLLSNLQFLLKSSPWGGFRKGLNISPLQFLFKSSLEGVFIQQKSHPNRFGRGWLPLKYIS